MSDPGLIEKAVQKFLFHRNRISALNQKWKAEVDAEKAEMEKLQVLLLRKLDSIGAKSLRVDSGLIVSTEKVTPTCGDWGAFLDWMHENRRLDLLQKRLAATQLKDDIETWLLEAKKTNPEAELADVLPPGIAVLTEREISIRKS